MDFAHEMQISQIHPQSSSFATAQSSTDMPGSEPTRKSHSRMRSPTRVPRPPNAFMLFRSDFLQKGIIPKDVESKQHNISRIAADCWARLTYADKQTWKRLADLKSEEHKRAHPGYQYKPTKRGPIQKRKQAMTADEEKAHCKELRARFLPETNGPLPDVPEPKPAWKRKSRAKPRTVQVHTSPQPSRIQARARLPPASHSSPMFMEPLLPPSVQEVAKQSYPNVCMTLDADLDPSMFYDLYASHGTYTYLGVEDNRQAESLVPAPVQAEQQISLSVARHIREKFENSRRGATFPTMTAEMYDAQQLYHPQAFFVSPESETTQHPPVQQTPRFPELYMPAQPYESPFAFPEDTQPNSVPTSLAGFTAQGLATFEALQDSSTPQAFPISLAVSSATPIEPLELVPSQFESRPNALDALTLSFDERSLEAVSADLALDDQFGLFGQPPSTLRVDSSSTDWSSGIMSDILTQDICSRDE